MTGHGQSTLLSRKIQNTSEYSGSYISFLSRCWSCAANSHCKGADFASWMSESVNVCLLVALAAKILDGGAGGCVLFVVSLDFYLLTLD